MNNNSIVVYRSEMERMQDEFWMEFMQSNASWLQYIYMAIFGVFALVALFIFYNVVKGFFKTHKR